MKKNMLPESFLEAEMPTALTADEDGKRFFFQFRTIKNEVYHWMIRRYSLSGRQWEDEFEGRMPCISVDGEKLFYVRAEKEGNDALYMKDLIREDQKYLGGFLRVREVNWSQDSRRVIFTAAVKERHAPEDLIDLEKSIWIDRTKFKTDEEGLFDGTYREIVIYDLESRQFVNISEGKRDLSCPCFIEQDLIAYLGIPYEPDNSDDYYLYIRNLKTGSVEKYRGPGGPVMRLAVSHDGRKIAMLAHDNLYWEATNFHIYVFDVEGRKWKSITSDYDRTFRNSVDSDTGLDNNQYVLMWDQNDQFIYSLGADGYSVDLYKIEEANGIVSNMTKDEAVIFAFRRIKNGFLTIRSSENCLTEILWMKENGNSEVLWQSELNRENYRLVPGSSFHYIDCEGHDRTARCFLPEGKIRGMILNIHGGPHYFHGYDFSYDIQLLLAYGYGTVICNPSGSQGAGQNISKASYHDWGGKDFRELMVCVEQANKIFHLEKLPWGVMGGSYGGFMVNWIIGHTDFFSCAISERSTCNRYSQAGTSDCAFRYGMYEFDGYAWENPKHYMQHSPISYVKNVRTPVLLLHGDKDMNCPVSQSEEWYSALKLEGKEAYFVMFPNEYHDYKGKGSPGIRKERYRLLLWWFQRYMKGERANGG